MRKAYNVHFINEENFELLIDCDLYANDYCEAIEKARDIFKYQLYKAVKGDFDKIITNVNEI